MITKTPAFCDDNDVNMLAALHECLRLVVVIMVLYYALGQGTHPSMALQPGRA